MSACNFKGEKVYLPRTGADAFWRLICREFDGDELAWKYLAMLALRENAGWPVERIALVFHHPKGHISRCLERIKQTIRDRFHAEPELHDHEEEATLHARLVATTGCPGPFGDATQPGDCTDCVRS